MQLVSVPYEITLLSNIQYLMLNEREFQYLMKLHYSQTILNTQTENGEFQYLMKLHYSQTVGNIMIDISEFQYLMKLHYSQTVQGLLSFRLSVSVPYEITLLSNSK